MLVLAAICGALSSPGQYTVRFLNPPGAGCMALGASNGQQVGFVDNLGAIWNGTAGSLVTLNPFPGWPCYVNAVRDNLQVGSASSSHGIRALVWYGNNESCVDLTPWGEQWGGAVLFGTDGPDQVGEVQIPNTDLTMRASLWHGTPESWVNLGTEFDFDSIANAVWGDVQVGRASSVLWDYNSHAIIWHGSSDDWIDVNPAGFSGSAISSVWGDTEVGSGSPEGLPGHAIMWHGTAESYVDLNPVWATSSSANAIVGNTIVGQVDGRATMWDATTGEAFDLQQYLPALDFGWSSNAWAIDEVTGDIVGWASNDMQLLAVVWSPGNGQTLVPHDQTVSIGRISSGDVASLASFDGNAEVLCKFMVPSFQSPIIAFRCDFDSPSANPTAIQAQVAAKLHDSGLFRASVYLHNFVTNTDDGLVLGQPLGSDYAWTLGDAQGNLTDYIGQDNTVQCAVTVSQTGPVVISLPCVAFEAVNIRIQ